MNKAKVQEEIKNIEVSIYAKGWKLTKATQKAQRELEELGLTEFVRDIGAAEIVNAVIAAATDAGGKKVNESGFTVYGDGESYSYTTEASALYTAMNETEEAAEEASPWGTWNDGSEIYYKQRGDIAPLTHERAYVRDGKVVSSGVHCLSAAWAEDDPYANVFLGCSLADLTAAGFEAKTQALRWLSPLAQGF